MVGINPPQKNNRYKKCSRDKINKVRKLLSFIIRKEKCYTF